MDNSPSTQTNGTPKVNLSAGMRLPPWKAGAGHPSPFSAGDMNLRDAVMNAFLNLAVKISQAAPNQDGSFTPSGDLTISNLNAILNLKLSPGTGGGGTVNIIPMQVQSYTTTNEYLSAKNGSFTAADTFTATGSAINVALPWELRPGDIGSVQPPYAANDIIWVLSTSSGQNGVYVSGSELTLMDLGLGRCWLGDAYFTLVSMFANYFTATDTVTGTTVAIAKNPELRNSIASEVIDTVTWTYTYLTTGTYKYVTRKADATISGTAVTEYQVIVPRYLTTTGLIKARQMPTGLTDGSSNPILWQEVSGREWAARASQAGYENT